MSQDTSNPYAPPTPEERPPELTLADDTEFLFNENCIVGKDIVRLPAICILSGRRDNLITQTKTLFWGYRGKIDVRYSVHPSAVWTKRLTRSILLLVALILFVIDMGLGVLLGILIVPFALSRFRTGPRIIRRHKGLYYLDGFCPEFLLQIRHIVERN